MISPAPDIRSSAPIAACHHKPLPVCGNVSVPDVPAAGAGAVAGAGALLAGAGLGVWVPDAPRPFASVRTTGAGGGAGSSVVLGRRVVVVPGLAVVVVPATVVVVVALGSVVVVVETGAVVEVVAFEVLVVVAPGTLVLVVDVDVDDVLVDDVLVVDVDVDDVLVLVDDVDDVLDVEEVVAPVVVVVNGGVQEFVIRLEFRVMAPSRASSRPVTSAPVLAVMDAWARIVPTIFEPVPSVAELPTTQNTLQADAPLMSETLLFDAVPSVDPAWKIHTEAELPCAFRVNIPVTASDDGDSYTPGSKVSPPRSVGTVYNTSSGCPAATL